LGVAASKAAAAAGAGLAAAGKKLQELASGTVAASAPDAASGAASQ
jgi:hypothetical protein